MLNLSCSNGILVIMTLIGCDEWNNAMNNIEETATCYAPVFDRAPGILRIPVVMGGVVCLAALSFAWIVTGNQKCQYSMKQVTFRIQNCHIGNDNPNLDLDSDIDRSKLQSQSVRDQAEESVIQPKELSVEDTTPENNSSLSSGEWDDDELPLDNLLQSITSQEDDSEWVLPTSSKPHQKRKLSTDIVETETSETYKIEFSSLPWKSPRTGIRFKSFQNGVTKMRLVEFSKDFIDSDWCQLGHIGYILEGQLVIDFSGTAVIFSPGDALFIPSGEKDKHKTRTLTDLVRVVLIEEA